MDDGKGYKARPIGKFLRFYIDGTTYAELKEKAKTSKRKIPYEAKLRLEESLSRIDFVEDSDNS